MNERTDEQLVADIRCMIAAADKPVGIGAVQRQLGLGYNRASRLLEEAMKPTSEAARSPDGETNPADGGPAAASDETVAEADDPTTTVTEDPEWGTEEHAAAFMLGRMIEVAKKAFTNLAEPWSKLKQREQERVLSRLHDGMKDVVTDAVKIIAANGRVTFRAEVESVQFKGPTDVKAQLKLVNSAATHALADVAGGFVTVVIEQVDELLALPEGALAGEPDNRPLFDESTAGTAVDTKPEATPESATV